jgi:hypothetical protein
MKRIEFYKQAYKESVEKEKAAIVNKEASKRRVHTCDEVQIDHDVPSGIFYISINNKNINNKALTVPEFSTLRKLNVLLNEVIDDLWKEV